MLSDSEHPASVVDPDAASGVHHKKPRLRSVASTVQVNSNTYVCVYRLVKSML